MNEEPDPGRERSVRASSGVGCCLPAGPVPRLQLAPTSVACGPRPRPKRPDRRPRDAPQPGGTLTTTPHWQPRRLTLSERLPHRRFGRLAGSTAGSFALRPRMTLTSPNRKSRKAILRISAESPDALTWT